jgi:hypothetical protein
MIRFGSCSAVVALVAECALIGCSSDDGTPASTGGSSGNTGGSGANSATPGGSGGAGGGTAERPVIGRFTVFTKVENFQEDSPGPAATDVTGTVNDGPTPDIEGTTPMPAPADATPGCAVYKALHANCDGIGGCGLDSQIPACARAAETGEGTCVCVADDVCQPNPLALNMGTVTVTGVATAAGATQYDLDSVDNKYNSANTSLAYPGMTEGSPLKISAKGGVYGDFELAAHGIKPVQLITPTGGYRILKDTADPSKWQALKVDWNPPDSPDSGNLRVILDLSRHASFVGWVVCDVKDTGSLTISAGLVTQVMNLGSIGGYPELIVIRNNSGTANLGPGKVELTVESQYERFPTIEGYTSCNGGEGQCDANEVCNVAIKMCEPA